MPGFALTAGCRAPVEEVWKLLFDPTRFPVVGGHRDRAHRRAGSVHAVADRVTVSCQVSDIDVVWQLAEGGHGTAIKVTVSLPEREARRLDAQRQVIQESLRRLTALAEAAA